MFALFAVLTSQLINFLLIQNQIIISVSRYLAFLISEALLQKTRFVQ